MANGIVTVEEYVDNARGNMYKFLFWEIRKRILEEFKTGVEEYAVFKKYVVYKKISDFASLRLKPEGLIVETKNPRFLSFGGPHPDDFGYSLDYQMNVINDSNLDEVMRVIRDSYAQTR